MTAAERPEWHARANCRTVHPDVMHPVDGEGERDALAICRGCPVEAPCLAYALANNIDVGIWGGRTARQRSRIRARGGLARQARADTARKLHRHGTPPLTSPNGSASTAGPSTGTSTSPTLTTGAADPGAPDDRP